MNIKKSLSRLVILTMLATGCSNYQVQNQDISLPDEATKQKTMTKVQNNVNEIIDKDYDYVLSNLGEPNVTEYWIDKTKIKNIETLENIEGVENLTYTGLVYFKKVSQEDTNSSALYLSLKDKVVKKAQIMDYSRANKFKHLKKSKIRVVYSKDADIVRMTDLDIDKLDNFIGMDSNEVETIVGDNQPAGNIYLCDKAQKSISVYYLGNKDKLLTVFTGDNKISEIKIFDNKEEAASEIKNIVLDN